MNKENNMRDVLLDIVKHTHSLGFIQAVKINGNTGNETEIEAMDDDRSVVLKGKLHNAVSDFVGTIGLGKLGVLSGYLNFEGYNDPSSKIQVVKRQRNNESVPEELQFSSTSGYNANYRFMVSALIDEKLKSVKFKGVQWDLTIKPTQQNIKDLSYWAGVMGSVEPTFVAKTDGDVLKLYIGDGSNDRVEIPFATGCQAQLKKGWAWPLAQTLSILKLSDTSQTSISFSEQGAMKISVDSGIGLYEYILPARTSS
tara:strand:- start:651 stop:1415 length:765 start_codon:yes stop_codon:yes gene_type:complete